MRIRESFVDWWENKKGFLIIFNWIMRGKNYQNERKCGF